MAFKAQSAAVFLLIVGTFLCWPGLVAYLILRQRSRGTALGGDKDPRHPQFPGRWWFRLCITSPNARTWWHWRHLVPRVLLTAVASSAAYVLAHAVFRAATGTGLVPALIFGHLMGAATAVGLWYATEGEFATFVIFGQQKRLARLLEKSAAESVDLPRLLSQLDPWTGGVLEGTPAAFRTRVEISALPDLPDIDVFRDALRRWGRPYGSLRQAWLEAAPQIREFCEIMANLRFPCADCGGQGEQVEVVKCPDCKGLCKVSSYRLVGWQDVAVNNDVAHYNYYEPRHIRCPACRGTGKVPKRSNCACCSGAGAVMYSPQEYYYVEGRVEFEEVLRNQMGTTVPPDPVPRPLRPEAPVDRTKSSLLFGLGIWAVVYLVFGILL